MSFQINTAGIEMDINREQARQAYNAVSFSPERRGDSVVAGYVETLQGLAASIEAYAKDERQQVIAQQVFEDLRARYKAKTLAWIGAKSRCMSSMITGPARFPVARAEKANRSEHNRSVELVAFSDKMKSYAERSLDAVIPREEKRVDEVEAQRQKVAKAEAAQEFMKKANALQRQGKTEELQKLFAEKYGDSGPAVYNQFMKPNYMNKVGFETWQLSNNLANIKRMKERLVELEAKAAKAEAPAEAGEKLNGLEIVRNHVEDRLQLVFAEKPNKDVIVLLKANGFKWSPRNTAWQRQLTANAEFSLKSYIMSQIVMNPYKEAASA